MASSTTNRQALRSQAARDQVVQAALTVFALKGYAAASMDDISLAAGLSKGGLYHHFPTKNAVLAGVVERLAVTGALYPPFVIPAGGPSISPESLGRVLIEVWAEAARDPGLRDRVRAGYEERLDAAIRDGIAEPAISDILRLGALIQMLAQDDIDTEAAARRLGISQAA